MTKGLENKIDTREIVRGAGMSARPEYYSGRGATRSDLNSDILEKVYKGIKNAHGEKAGKEFVKMVSDIPKLSATDFLLSLYKLEGNKWKWKKGMYGNEKGVYVDGQTDEAKFAVGMMTIAGVLYGDSERDDTPYIRNPFLAKHEIMQKPKKNISGYFWGGK